MTKSDLRKARKAARAAGQPLTGPLALPCDEARDDARDTQIFTESRRGRNALDRWARRYDALNGAPEGPDDY